MIDHRWCQKVVLKSEQRWHVRLSWASSYFCYLSQHVQTHSSMESFCFKAAKYQNEDPLLDAENVSLQFLGQCFAFFNTSDQLVARQKDLLRCEEICSLKMSTGLLWVTNFGFVAFFSSNSQIVHCSCCTISWGCLYLVFCRFYILTRQNVVDGDISDVRRVSPSLDWKIRTIWSVCII